jgi:hypothetical protein
LVQCVFIAMPAAIAPAAGRFVRSQQAAKLTSKRQPAARAVRPPVTEHPAIPAQQG